jgi:hypothetical protein
MQGDIYGGFLGVICFSGEVVPVGVRGSEAFSSGNDGGCSHHVLKTAESDCSCSGAFVTCLGASSVGAFSLSDMASAVRPLALLIDEEKSECIASTGTPLSLADSMASCTLSPPPSNRADASARFSELEIDEVVVPELC